MNETNTKVGMSYKELADAHFNLQERYYELIMAVETKHPNETRHQTALRYIREAEKQSSSISHTMGEKR